MLKVIHVFSFDIGEIATDRVWRMPVEQFFGSPYPFSSSYPSPSCGCSLGLLTQKRTDWSYCSVKAKLIGWKQNYKNKTMLSWWQTNVTNSRTALFFLFFEQFVLWHLESKVHLKLALTYRTPFLPGGRSFSFSAFPTQDPILEMTTASDRPLRVNHA